MEVVVLMAGILPFTFEILTDHALGRGFQITFTISSTCKRMLQPGDTDIQYDWHNRVGKKIFGAVVVKLNYKVSSRLLLVQPLPMVEGLTEEPDETTPLRDYMDSDFLRKKDLHMFIIMNISRICLQLSGKHFARNTNFSICFRLIID